MQKRIKSYLRIIIISLLLSVGYVWLICYLGECTLSKALEGLETRAYIRLAVGVNVYIFATCVFAVIMNLLPIPELPNGPWKKEQLIVCRYSELTYSGIVIVCIALGSAALYGCFSCLIGTSGEHNWETALFLGVLTLMFIPVGVLFFCYMKNQMIIFFPDGVFYQNIFKKTYVAMNEQIEWFNITSFRHAHIKLHTANRNVYIGHYCSEYQKAKEYARSHYVDFSSYREE